MDHLERWRKLSGRLSDEPTVTAEAVQAVEDPAAYFAEHRTRLSSRGIIGPESVTGTIALIDALQAADQLAYLDWKASPEETIDACSILPRVRVSGADLSDPAATAPVSDVWSTVRVINHRLRDVGLAFVMLNEWSDAYPLALIRLEDRRSISALARGAGLELNWPTPIRRSS